MSMEHSWNCNDMEKTEVLGRTPVSVPLCPPQIPHGGAITRMRPSTDRLRNHGKASGVSKNITASWKCCVVQMKPHHVNRLGQFG